MPIETPEPLELDQLGVPIDEAMMGCTGEVVLWLKNLVLSPCGPAMPGKSETDHRTGKIVASVQVARGGIVGLRPGIDPVAVRDHRGRGGRGTVGVALEFLGLLVGRAEIRVIIAIE